jgi:S1-C subfamily serine protease
MKWIFSACVFILMLSAAVAQQTNLLSSFDKLKAKAEAGDAQSQFELCADYVRGDGVPENKAEAIKWCRRAADQGYAAAEFNLGMAYSTGDEVPQDYIKAYKWFDLAAAQDFSPAILKRDKLAALMMPSQISEALQLSTAFVPKKEVRSSNSSDPFASGSGFFITDDGYLITNNHVVRDATKVRLVTSSGTFDAKVVQVDAANDLALLKADGKFSSLPVAASRSAHLGGTVATIGFPDPSLQGFSPKLAKGEIASLSGAGDDPRYFQISVPVQPGNSGGALVDEQGNVIGIVSAKLNASAALAASGQLPENVNYAVKSSFLLSFLESTPDVSAKLKDPITIDRKFEDVVKSAQDAAVLVLVY